MTDDEMRAMPIPTLQDEGLLFLWVTGRAMEIGRECLRVWGYTRVDEVIWVKTNQVCLSPLFCSSLSTSYHPVRTAPARHSHRQDRPLAQSYKGTHVSRCENQLRR